MSAENSEDPTNLSVDCWVERWKERKIGFHRDVIHVMLEKHIDKLTNGQENLVIFLPLCGKSLDIKWLAEKGHKVVGLEGSSMALEEFFKEQNIPHTIEELAEIKGSLYKSEDNKIHLYCCDMYDFNSSVAGQVDAIWDRGSMVAINRCDRERYVDIMKSLMKPSCRMLLDTFDYNETLYPGPPRYISEDQIDSLYGGWCSVERIDYFDAYEEKHKGWGLDSFHERLHLIVKKS